jgi:mannose-6-phosphate isomerase
VTATAAAPLVLPPNQFHRFYAGGARIDALRGNAKAEGKRPEDWIGSTTTTFGATAEGLSRVADGRLVRDLVRENPEALLGPEHVARFGADPGLLVKLLDAGERLPVHLHPGREFAATNLGSHWGKTEAWLILDAEPGASVHAGLNQPVDDATLHRWVADQDAKEMLAALHEIPVQAGDALLIPAGTLHAIGAGILLLELQEPTDFSVLVEWRRFGMNSGTEHLGLGWETALRAVDTTPADPAAFKGSQGRLPHAAAPYFRAERPQPGAELQPSFAVLLAASGEGTLQTQHGGELLLNKGTTALVPHAAGTTSITGELDAIRCLPPDPNAGSGDW